MQQWHVVDMEYINNKPQRHVVYTNVVSNLNKMQNGIIYSVLKFVFDNLKYLSIVELFKFLFVKFFADRNDVLSRVKYSRLAVDIFIILKWTLVIVLLKWSINNSFLTFLVWYLII